MKRAAWLLLTWMGVSAGWTQEPPPALAYEFGGEPELPSIADLHMDPETEALLRAERLLNQGQRVEALTELRAILKRDVHHVSALSLVAATLSEMGRQREAIQLFEKLAAEHARDFVVLNNLAWLQATATESVLRNPERAVHLARQALLLAPVNYSVWSTMAEAYYRNGQYVKAHRAAQQAMQLAQEQKADGPRLITYAEQVNKCREAMEAFTLLDP